MESILSLFVFHDTYVVSFLVIGITIIVVMLLLFNNRGPSSVVRREVEGSDNIEGALRRVLGEKNWSPGRVSSEGGSEKLDELEQEVLEKDRKIAELNKQLTQSSGSSGEASSGEMSAGAGAGDNSDLLAKIGELEEKLMEYEIIEDDIADLSLYKTENEKLKEELARLKALAGSEEEPVVEDGDSENDQDESPPDAEEAPAPEAASEEDEVVEEVAEEALEPEPEEDEEPAPKKVQPADLVAEFEKVVNNQVELDEEADTGSVEMRDTEAGEGGVQGPKDEDAGTVTMKDTEKKEASASTGNEELKNEIKIHPKLRNVDPDSKEEAEVFITELKSLKKGSQS